MNQLIDHSDQQIFVLSCSAHLPFFFAQHSWVVLNDFGTVSRWEILFRKHDECTNWGHLTKNFLPPFKGLPLVPGLPLYLKANLLFSESGQTAERMISLVEKSPEIYPYTERYSLTGPNSNTYIKWVLKNAPKTNLELPSSLIGKDYPI